MKPKNVFYFIISFLLITVIGLSVFFISQSSSNKPEPIINRKSQEMIDFFENNKEKLNSVNNFLSKKHYAVQKIEKNGYLQIDNSDVWLNQVSPLIKDIFDAGDKFGIYNMYFDEHAKEQFSIEFYCSDYALQIYIVYSETDLSLDSNMYSNIEGNWYLFVAGMT